MSVTVKAEPQTVDTSVLPKRQAFDTARSVRVPTARAERESEARPEIIRLVKPVSLTVPESEVELIAVGFLDGVVIVDVMEEGSHIVTMSLEQYITHAPYVILDFIPGILNEIRSHPTLPPESDLLVIK